MPLMSCRTCGSEVAKDAPVCVSCGAPHPSGHFQSEQSWKNLAPSFGRLTGSTFLGVLLWSLIPVAIWFLAMVTVGSMPRGM